MILIRLVNRIKKAEGLRLAPYKDTRGIWTIGYGTTHWDKKPVTKDWPNISEHFAVSMLFSEIVSAGLAAEKFVNNFNILDSIRQEALIEMAYQLGPQGQRGFVKAKEAIEHGNWIIAKEELLDSRWANQTVGRALRIANMIYFGDYYEDRNSSWI